MLGKVSFDFDGCLSNPNVQDIAKGFIGLGYDVWITTSRWRTPNMGDNNDLYEVANKLGIPESKIQFTHHQLKKDSLTDFLFHFDDNPKEDCLVGCKFILIQTGEYL